MSRSTRLFSSYSNTENRVTSTILSVFERLSFNLVESILQKALDKDELDLVIFENQSNTGGGSVPDAEIKARFRFVFETKVTNNSINTVQLENHIQSLSNPTDELVYMTPDEEIPKELSSLNNDKVSWFNFGTLVDSIDETIEEEEILSERENYLLLELKEFLYAEELIKEGMSNRVLVIPARNAIKEYKQHGIYMCQPNRTFRPSRHLAFYHNNKIDTLVPKIYAYIDSVNLKEESLSDVEERINYYDKSKKEFIRKKYEELRKTELRERTNNKILFVSEKDSKDTTKLDKVIQNNKMSKDGSRRVAYTQNQRYTTLDSLKEADKTMELE